MVERVRCLPAFNAQLKSVRPLKSKLATLQKKHKTLAESVRTCIESAKSKGAEKIGEEFIAEAEKLAAEKGEIEHQINRLKAEIEQKERGVASEQIVADSLLRFNELRKHMPPEDQKELVRMFIHEIVVNAVDQAEKEEKPSKSVNQLEAAWTGEKLKRAIFETKIRTKWYQVNLGLYGSALFSGVLNKAMRSSDFSQIGSCGWIRTNDPSADGLISHLLSVTESTPLESNCGRDCFSELSPASSLRNELRSSQNE